VSRRTPTRQQRAAERGQSLVELSLIIPVFLMLLLGMLEFGMAFDHAITITYATREGARVGAALVNGGGTAGCSTGQSPNAAAVDPQIVAAVERVLTSPGSQIRLSAISEIRIYKATATGTETTGLVDVWRYSLNGGPAVDGAPLDFAPVSTGWLPCNRTNTLPAPSVGVSIQYRYTFATPLAGIFALTGGTSASGLDMSDRSVMAMNPTQ
jgi:hypothetical protein